jgi:hypothetical protein
MVKKLFITSCTQCCHFYHSSSEYHGESLSACEHPDIGRKLVTYGEQELFPKWCPLEDE